MKTYIFLFLLFVSWSLFAQPNFEQVGFSTQNGGTTGGAGGQIVTVNNYSDLKNYAESSSPYIIMVEGTITNGSGGGVVNVNSNTSIIGVGSTAFLSGISLNISGKSNIILQNFKQTLVGTSSPKSINDGDCIGISGASRNIWIDHLELYSENPDVQTDIDKYDGLIDIKQQSGWITISWCYLHDHHKGGLVGASDSDLYGDRNVTYHHNYYNKVKLRVPMFRGATGHFFNNYIKDAKKASEIRANTCVRIEKNYYENFAEFAIYTTSDSPGKTERIDNYLSKSQSRAFPSSCTANIPYNYTTILTNNVQDVKSVVQQYAGVGKMEVIKDCNGDENGDAYLDDCDVCVGGNTGKTACFIDCNGVVDGTAEVDDCGVCVSGNTGKTACSSALQGEDFCTAAGVLEDKNEGFSGEGYLNLDNALGTSAKWYLVAEKADIYSIGLRYANGSATARGFSIEVNGIELADVSGNPTGGWTTWTEEFVSLTLNVGVNEITVISSTSDGAPNIDLFVLNDPALKGSSCEEDCNGVVGGGAFIDDCNTCVGGTTGESACTQDCEGTWGGTKVTDDCGVCLTDASIQPCIASLEAETACNLDGVVDNNNAGFSGDGFANTENVLGASVSWLLHSNAEQTATFTFRYANGGATARSGEIRVNGQSVGILELAPTKDWTTWANSTVNVDLTTGNNEIVIAATTSDGLANLDIIYFSEDVSDAQCGTITVLGESDAFDLEVYPNPVQNTLCINKEVTYILESISGELITKGIDSSIDTSTLPNGIYLLKVEAQVFRIIKE